MMTETSVLNQLQIICPVFSIKFSKMYIYINLIWQHNHIFRDSQKRELSGSRFYGIKKKEIRMNQDSLDCKRQKLNSN